MRKVDFGRSGEGFQWESGSQRDSSVDDAHNSEATIEEEDRVRGQIGQVGV